MRHLCPSPTPTYFPRGVDREDSLRDPTLGSMRLKGGAVDPPGQSPPEPQTRPSQGSRPLRSHLALPGHSIPHPHRHQGACGSRRKDRTSLRATAVSSHLGTGVHPAGHTPDPLHPEEQVKPDHGRHPRAGKYLWCARHMGTGTGPWESGEAPLLPTFHVHPTGPPPPAEQQGDACSATASPVLSGLWHRQRRTWHCTRSLSSHYQTQLKCVVHRKHT